MINNHNYKLGTIFRLHLYGCLYVYRYSHLIDLTLFQSKYITKKKSTCSLYTGETILLA